MGRLDGKVALISGAAGGQGEAETRLFLEEGARVAFGDVQPGACAAVAADLGEAALGLDLDVRTEESWQASVEATLEAFGQIDVLINNAGIVRPGTVESLPIDMYRDIVDVNQHGVFFGMRAVVPAMREAGGGSIVNISSDAGLLGVHGVFGYSATKWAVRGMTKTAAIELAPYGIRVNSVHPGLTDTPMTRFGDILDAEKNPVLASQPIPRAARADEIAKLVLFLASDESSYSTGSEFVADGGRSAGYAPGGERL